MYKDENIYIDKLAIYVMNGDAFYAINECAERLSQEESYELLFEYNEDPEYVSERTIEYLICNNDIIEDNSLLMDNVEEDYKEIKLRIKNEYMLGEIDDYIFTRKEE
jgi:hypothetical protein